MPKCEYCDIRFSRGGFQVENEHFCSQRCYDEREILVIADSLKYHDVDPLVQAAHQGICPLCQGPGPVDIHITHHIVSLIFASAIQSQEILACRSCGIQAQLKAMSYCAMFGWWSFFGIFLTPAQIFQNLAAMSLPPNHHKPSKAMRKRIRHQMAAELHLRRLADQQAQLQKWLPGEKG